jgi:hypothetical protein
MSLTILSSKIYYPTREWQLAEIDSEKHYSSETRPLYRYYNDQETDIINQWEGGGFDLTVTGSEN